MGFENIPGLLPEAVPVDFETVLLQNSLVYYLMSLKFRYGRNIQLVELKNT